MVSIITHIGIDSNPKAIPIPEYGSTIIITNEKNTTQLRILLEKIDREKALDSPDFMLGKLNN